MPRIPENRQFKRLRKLRGGDQKVCHRLQAFAGDCADQRDRGAELPCQGQYVHLAALLMQFVCHVQQDKGWHAQGNYASGQYQMAVEIVRVEYQNDRIRPLGSGHYSIQYIDCDLFVL